jgi:hypothetical protein
MGVVPPLDFGVSNRVYYPRVLGEGSIRYPETTGRDAASDELLAGGFVDSL